LNRQHAPIGIFEHLLMEEGLLRATTNNYLLVSKSPSMQRAVVMGLSSANPKKLPALIYADQCHSDNVPVIRRFSGGGTVYIDNTTLFTSVICNSSILPSGVEAYPKPLMKWSSDVIFGPALSKLLNRPDAQQYALQENDYCVGKRKWGGNAQSLVKDRFLHHTSILWKTDLAGMEQYLRIPPTEIRPKYREDRSHSDFVIGLDEVLNGEVSDSSFLDAVVEAFSAQFDEVENTSLDEVKHTLSSLEYRRSTEIVDLTPYL
jgi:lipoate-protein ligase A